MDEEKQSVISNKWMIRIRPLERQRLDITYNLTQTKLYWLVVTIFYHNLQYYATLLLLSYFARKHIWK